MFKNDKYYLAYFLMGISLVTNFITREQISYYVAQEKEIRKNDKEVHEFDKEVYSFYKKIIGYHISLENRVDPIYYYTHYMSEKFMFELQFDDLYKNNKCQEDTVKLVESLVKMRRMYNSHLKKIFIDKKREEGTLNKELQEIYKKINTIKDKEINKEYLYEIGAFVKFSCLSLYFTKTFSTNDDINCSKEFTKIINFYNEINKASATPAYILRVQNNITDLYGTIKMFEDKKFEKIKEQYVRAIEKIRKDNLDLCLRSGEEYKLVLDN